MKKKIILSFMICSLIITTLSACSDTNSSSSSSIGSESSSTSSSSVDNSSNSSSSSQDGTATASVDGTTSASIVPENLVQKYTPSGFKDESKKKALFVVADPRKYSVNYDLVNTAMKHFEENGVEVELRDLYDMKFNPVLSADNFYYAKDGNGTPSPEIKKEQDLVTQADYIIFCYPNWHDTPTAIVKGYMETVFAKKFAYQDGPNGLEGLLKGKSIYTIMNAGFLGGGRGYINDGVGIDDKAWNEYMNAFKVLDDDTAGFWGTENKGRFVNDRTPKNNSENYEKEINELRDSLKSHLNKVFFNK